MRPSNIFRRHNPSRALARLHLALPCVTSALLLCGLRASAQTTLSLHEAIQRATTGPAAQLSAARVSQARGMVTQAGLRPNPRLYLQSEDLRPWADNFSFPTQTEDYGYLGQVFEIDGKRTKRLTLARARERQAEAESALQLRAVAGRVTAAYWTAVSLTRIAALLRDDMKVVGDMVRYHQQRVDAGAMRGVDLLRMQIERDRLAITLAAAERDAAQAKLELFRQMGQEPAEASLTDQLEDAPTLAPITLQTALQQRPDVQAAREALLAARADVTLQRAVGVPDPDILAGYKRNNSDNTGYVSLQIPLPFRNRNQGEVERARAGVDAAQASLLLLERQVNVDITQAQQAYEAQRKIVQETLPDMRARAKQNLDITAEAYRLGGIDLLRFIDAERTAFEVEVSALRTLAQLQQSAVTLQLAYGVQP